MAPPNKKQKTNQKEIIDTVYEEKINVSKLAYVIANAEQIGLKPLTHLEHNSLCETVNALKELLNNISVNADEFPYGRMHIKYWRYQGMPYGRIYPNKLGYCNLSKVLRHTLSDNLYFDIDINNCHPTLYLYLSEKYQIKQQYKLDLSYLETYVNDRDNVLKEAAELNNTDVDTIKEWFLKVYSGADAINIPLQMTFVMEQTFEKFSVLRALLYNAFTQDVKYKNLESMEMIRYFSIIIQDYENDIRNCIEEWCNSKEFQWSVNCFDGGMLLKESINTEWDLADIEKYIQDKLNIDVKLSCKSMDKYSIAISEDALQTYNFEYIMAICGKNSNDYETRKSYFELNNF
jgi:hypothetical protein